RNGNFPLENKVFRSARVTDGVLARLERNGFAILAIDLRMEAKVRRQAPAQRGIIAAVLVLKHKGAHHRFAVEILDAQLEEDSRCAVKLITDPVALGNWLVVALAPQAKADPGFLAAGVLAVDLQDPVFQLQPG